MMATDSSLLGPLFGLVAVLLFFFAGYCSGRRWCTVTGSSYSVFGTVCLGLSFYVVGGLILYPLGVPLKYWATIWLLSAFSLSFDRTTLLLPLLQLKSQLLSIPKYCWVLVALAVGTRFTAYFEGTLNPVDDDLAYIPFVQKILHVGSVFDPLNHRRGSSYLGQCILQTLPTFFSPLDGYQVIETVGFYSLFLLGLVETLQGSNRLRQIPALICISVLTVIPNINHTAHTTTLCYLLFLYEVVRKLEAQPSERPWKYELAVASASLASLRGNYVPWVAVFFVSLLARSASRKERASALQIARAGFLVAATLALPAIDMYRSIGSPLFPLLDIQHVDASLKLFGPFWSKHDYFFSITGLLNVDIIFSCFIYFTILGSHGMLRCFLFATLILSLAAACGPYQLPPSAVVRYYHPFILITLLWNLSAVWQDLDRLPTALSQLHARYRFVAKSINILLVTLLTAALLQNISYPGSLSFLVNPNVSGIHTTRALRIEQRGHYNRLLTNIPSTATVLSAVSFPGLISQTDHPLLLLDVPGQIAPFAELRNFREPTTFLASLRRIGIDYFIFEDPSSPTAVGIYSRAYWKAAWAMGWHKNLSFLPYWRHRLDEYFSLIEKLKLSGAVEAEGANVTIINVTRSLEQMTTTPKATTPEGLNPQL